MTYSHKTEEAENKSKNSRYPQGSYALEVSKASLLVLPVVVLRLLT